MANTKKAVLYQVSTSLNVLLVVLLTSFILVLIAHYFQINFLIVAAIIAAIIGTSWWRIRTTTLRKVAQSLQSTDVLEQWAERYYVDNEIPPIPLTTPIGVTIAKLQQQLLIELNNDSSFDLILKEKALLDKDTGIGNREFFNNRLAAILREDDIHGAIFLIQFKEVETVHTLYGKQQAISLLTTFVNIIKHRLDNLPGHFIARRNDFELALLLPNLYVQEAEKLAERIITNCMATPLPVGVSNEELIHIGICFFKHELELYQVMSEADMALRSAQLQGPSQWFMYDKNEIVQAKGSLRWRTLITKALKNKNFVLFFQPIISVKNDQIVHHELLTKLEDSNGKLISGRVFFPMAHKCGLIQEVDLHIAEQACQLIAQEKDKMMKYSLNLSIESLLSEAFVERFLSLLSQHSQATNRLTIEVNEYHLVSHLVQLSAVLKKFHAKGLTLLADKVGQYVVNARYLKECPISYIKLHRSLILDIDKKVENQVVIQSLQAMTKPLNLKILALGIETLEEWQTLKRLGIDGGQGHYFSQPLEQRATAIG